jgi:hypothetical protein
MRYNLIIGANADGFRTFKRPESALIRLLEAHDELLTAIISKPAVVAVYWDDDETSATFTIIPCDCTEEDANKPFATFTLPFPVP